MQGVSSSAGWNESGSRGRRLRLPRKVVRFAIGLCVAALSVQRVAAAAEPGHKPPPRAVRLRLAAVEAAIDSQRVRLHIPGLALAIVENDRVVLFRGFGYRNIERREPVDSMTVF